MDFASLVQAIVGILALTLVPGYAWMRVLAPMRSRIERFVIAVGLSISLMVLALYVGNVALGIRISASHAIWYSLAITFAAFAWGVSASLSRRVQLAMARA